jgi:hypothetical protein
VRAVVAQRKETRVPQQLSRSPASLAEYIALAEWLDLYAGRFFDTRSALDWFVRRHRAELIERGALIPRAGRSGSLAHAEKFSKAVVAIHKREAQERSRAVTQQQRQQQGAA